MNIFVAAWYYPPVTSSEGIVTYKLLRKSGNNYDVCSSLSEKWSYHTSFGSYDEPNITTHTIDTDSIDEWVDYCVDKFEELYPARKYECIMTRSTPPESILVGLKIKERHPDVKWIASLADPVANNPYELHSYIDDNPLLTKREKKKYRNILMNGSIESLKPLRKRAENGIRHLCKLKEWEEAVIRTADMIICPTERQLSYLDGEGGWKSKYYALPHSYCTDFYPEKVSTEPDKIVFTYTGYSDKRRSLKPFVDAVNLLKRSGSPALDRILFRFVGNTPREISDMVLNFDLQDQIHIEGSVDYYESLGIMKASDWLIHVDAYFDELEPGGSIFFAGKIADYLGAEKPVLALTGKDTPACRIIEKSGGIVADSGDVIGIADTIENIVYGNIRPVINKEYTQTYEAGNIAARFDSRLEEMCAHSHKAHEKWHEVRPAKNEKLLSVCVPSYNVQRCLDRCLYTLTSCEYAPYMDIIVVDDGSKDSTLQIAKEYEKQFPGIVRAVHKENGGHGSTINVAMDMAVGKYFRVVDSDDWIDSREQDKILARIKSGEIDTDIISANYHIVSLEEGTLLPIEQDCVVEYDKALDFSEIDTDKVYFTMAGSMIKTDVIRKMDMKLQEKTFYVDVEFILYPVPYLNTVMFVDNYVYKYSQGSSEQSVYVPNMVKRYDHHNRVMKRVIEYRVKTPMGEAQAHYYDSILKRVLYTHYSLCTVYDNNKVEGYRRMGEFDKFILSAYPEMAKWAGKRIPTVAWARKSGYDYNKVKKSPGNAVLVSKQKAKGVLIANKALAVRLLKNKYTYRVATSKFFTEGKGLAFRNKVYNALMK